MLRILHSLPRTHKLLLIPVATMVTVLGTHKILAAFDDTGNTEASRQVNLAVGIPASSDTSDSVNSVATVSATETPPVAALQPAAANSPDDEIPLADLAPQGIVDIDFIQQAQAAQLPPTADPLPLQPAGSSDVARADTIASPASIGNDVLQVALQLARSTPTDMDGSDQDVFSSDPLVLDDGDVDLANELAAKEVFVPQWETYTVQPGDTFAVMAQRTFGLGYSEVIGLLDELPDKQVLTRWRVGDNLDFKLDENGHLLALRVMKNAREGYLIERDGGDAPFDVATVEKATEATQRLFAGTVSGSFAGSAEATGLSNGDVADLTNLLAKKINFRRDARRGDHFQVLVESDMVDGQAMDSRILAAHYEGQRTDLTVVRNDDDDRFYTPDGHSLDPAFDRYPFNGHYRISSSFNLRRVNPVTGRVSPHYGTDFAMPRGTPVRAPADGRVVKAAYQRGGAGNYLVIRQDNGYKTRYMHLSKTLVKEGQRIHMGEKIALSGNTGRSTGPHLHYEIIVNNRPVDAMRVKLPESKNLSGKALAAFKKQSKELLAKLEDRENGQLAKVSPSKHRPDDI
ncbi:MULTISPECIES: peptidoglycan DD-metalloendopeptidase family protein [unclassified Modicisalibacter]|uniref:peptidoglycan DD-metalloendopeptidase family protein n=1 Tax=unclassified Modicisalibacter TaxID=2679913 RepID=UPI001CC90007|nr:MULTISPECIES: peptidoglycan DD-metalloendopeptidase family protein [unclassified Modicisalibacter]MBZ9560169.1 peptidoglycan DD-metalloendopeptidase family protein [Modicisalibacter sp. R2A 31.J]MBZ9576077.1 peptidoglycan DD-metalloendopeptidase family protein [Modicisalibacter sp. MOD 31.J]